MINHDIWAHIFSLVDFRTALSLRYASRELFHVSNEIPDTVWSQYLKDIGGEFCEDSKNSIIRLSRPLNFTRGPLIQCSQKAGPPSPKTGFLKHMVYIQGPGNLGYVMDYQEWTVRAVETPGEADTTSWYCFSEFNSEFESIVLEEDCVVWKKQKGADKRVQIPPKYRITRQKHLFRASNPNQTFVYLHRHWEDSEETDKQDFLSDILYVNWKEERVDMLEGCTTMASANSVNCLLLNGLLFYKGPYYTLQVRNMLTGEHQQVSPNGMEIGYHDDRYVCYNTLETTHVIDTLTLVIYPLTSLLFDFRSGIQHINGQFLSWLHPAVGSGTFDLEAGQTMSLSDV
ncbi:hypothetical protein CJU89_0692 [Yarrowia sp. B02]|nr:hypothetical protein CJU89_0692 [Yarrowia sp. B02]